MNTSEVIHYWKNSSAEDFSVAQDLFTSKRYPYSLFFCHLALEKLLKAIIVHRTGASAPYQHHLVRLAELATIAFSENDLDLLDEITTFNIKGRYDDYKTAFYKKATREYASKYMDEVKRLILWLQNNYPTIS